MSARREAPGRRYVRPDLTRAEWDAMSEEERRAFVRALERELVARLAAAVHRPGACADVSRRTPR